MDGRDCGGCLGLLLGAGVQQELELGQALTQPGGERFCAVLEGNTILGLDDCRLHKIFI